MIEVKKYNILVIDDESSNIVALTRILSPDYNVRAAINGAEGIRTAKKYLPDIIMLDVVMPEMDGYEIITELKNNKTTADIPVIFISGLREAEDERKGLALGAADYIFKPFLPEIVKLRVRNQVKMLEHHMTEYDIMKYKLTTNALNIALWDMDVIMSNPVNPDNEFTWSREFREILGFTDVSDFPNLLHSWADRLHPEDKERTLKAFAAHIVDLTGKTPYDIEYRLLHKNGEYRHFHAFGETLRSDEGTPLRVAGAIMDITDKKEAEEAARKAIIAEESDKAKSRFLANMSHEIRTPMNAILGFTEILMQNETLTPSVSEGLERIYASCNLLLGIINDILDFSKIEAGKLDIIDAEYQTASLINDSVQLNIMRIGDKPIKFELLVDENIPAKLIGDVIRIKQVLNNLLSNAFKYTQAGKVTLSFTSIAKPHSSEVSLIFSVCDTGAGMSEEQVNKLFDEYSRFNEEGSNRTIEGTGLGLAITRNLLLLMNSEIHVESEPGKGSLFTVRIPQRASGSEKLGKKLTENLQKFRLNDLTVSEKNKAIKISREPMPYGSVLVVDDVQTNIYVAVGLLKLYGLQIDTASSGREAIDKINNGGKYDIVFMDYMMPVMDGLETTKNLRDSGYTGTIVALTADAVAGQSDMFLQNGFDAFLSKPIDVRQLDSVLLKLIRDKHPPEVIEAARKHAKSASAADGDGSALSPMLIESFIRDTRNAVAVLEDMLEAESISDEENLRTYIITVHGIKSALANIGESQLSVKASELEKAGRENDLDTVTADSAAFLEELRSLLEKYEKSQNEGDAGSDFNVGELRDKLSEIADMCADYNRKGVLAALSDIKNCPAETKAVLESINEHVRGGDFDEAESTARAHIENLPSENNPDDSKQVRAEKITAFMQNTVIEGLDIAKGIERYGGSGDAYLKVLRNYAAGYRSLIDSLVSFNTENPRDYIISIHSVKGTSYEIFANTIGDKAKELEAAAHNGNIEFIDEHNPPLLKEVWRLVNDMEALFKEIEEQTPKHVKDKPDKDILIKLREACATYSVNDMDDAMEEIERFKYEADDGLADWLREKADLMRFKEIVEKLSEII